MKPSFGIVYPLWNALGADPDRFEQVVGEVGVDHVTVPVITGPVAEFHLTPNADAAPLFTTEGGWHYAPDTAPYRAAAAKPVRARWTKQRNMLDAFVQRCREHQLALFFRVDLRHEPHNLEGTASVQWRDAWGQPLPAGGACVLAPEVRELARAACEDLKRYEPEGLQLVDWTVDPRQPARAHPLAWCASAARLAATCFSPAARQSALTADLDPDRVAACVREQVLASVCGPATDADATPEIVQAYQQVLEDDNQRWLEQWAAAVPFGRKLLLSSVTDHAPVGGWERLISAGEPADLDRGITACGNSDGNLALPVWKPTFGESQDLVRTITQAREAGAAFFDFEGVHTAPHEAITWLKQAVRFARRV
jgi:hypothetical protein